MPIVDTSSIDSVEVFGVHVIAIIANGLGVDIVHAGEKKI